MKTIKEACLELSISPTAFDKTLRCAIRLFLARGNLTAAISEDFAALRDEGLTDKEEEALKLALKYTIGE